MASTRPNLRMLEENRRKVLSLYRRCIRSAQKCPEFQHQETYLNLIRTKFHENKKVNPRDIKTVQRMIAEAEEEVNSMDYYHNLRESRKNERSSN